MQKFKLYSFITACLLLFSMLFVPQPTYAAHESGFEMQKNSLPSSVAKYAVVGGVLLTTYSLSELKEKSKVYFEENTNLEGLFATSDGNFFLHKADAQNRKRELMPKKAGEQSKTEISIYTINRSDLSEPESPKDDKGSGGTKNTKKENKTDKNASDGGKKEASKEGDAGNTGENGENAAKE
jgi:hypothetical protein